MEGGPTIEILDVGRSPPRPGRLGPWLRAHRRIALGAAVLSVAGTGLAAVRLMPGDDLPPLVVEPDGPASLPLTDLWEAGGDDRPSGPVVLSVRASVRASVPHPSGDPRGGERSGRADDEVRVLGLAGPGVLPDEPADVIVPAAGAAVQIPLRAGIDCTRVPAVVPDDAYRLRVQVGPRAQRRTGTVAAGAPGRSWGRAVQLGCNSWAARRALTATAARVELDPQLPQVAVTLTVTNVGDREATLDRQTAPSPTDAVRLTGRLPVEVPARASATTQVTVRVQDCARFTTEPTETTIRDTTLIGLAALAGPAPDPGTGGAVRAAGWSVAGLEPTGVVLAEPGGGRLRRALRRACGDLGAIATLVPPSGVRFDEPARDLAVDAVIDVSPGRVRSVALQADRSAAPAGPSLTLRPPEGELVPDRTGQVRTTLHFAVPPGTRSCSQLLQAPPGIRAILRVPGEGRDRDRLLPFALLVDITQATARAPTPAPGCR